MIRMTFQSGLKEKEKQFVAFKQQFGHTYEARIYNLLDFDRFFADSMERYYQSTVRHLVAPVMFRFMYCCGLRPCEARCCSSN